MFFFILGDKEEKEVLDKSEFISYVKEGSKSGVLNEIESKMLENLMSYKDFPVKKLLIPRQKMAGFNLDDLPENLIQAVKKFKYNTIPVFDKLKDHIVGVLTKRTLLNKSFGEKIDKETILRIIENPYIVPENKDIVDVLIDLQKLQHEICLVSDEHGGTEGIVTRSDIINKLFGRTENGEIEQETIKLTEGNRYRINPNVPLEEFNEYFKIEFKSEYCKTIGGYIIEKLHNIPKTGDKIKIESFSFHIKKATRRKIISMILTKVK